MELVLKRIIKILRNRNINISIYDPLVSDNQLDKKLKNIKVKKLISNKYDALVYALDHDIFHPIELRKITRVLKKKSFVYDIKSILPKTIVDKAL